MSKYRRRFAYFVTGVKSETHLHCKVLPVSAGDTLKDIMRIALLITRFIHELD